MIRHFLTSSCLALLLISSVHAQPSPVIHNGGFESPAPRTGAYTLLTTGTAFPGWRVVGGSGNVATVDSRYTWLGTTFPAYGGKVWMDLTGIVNRALGVEQTVATVPGGNYHLSFQVGNVIDGGRLGTTSTIEVLIDGRSVMRATNSQGRRRVITWQRFDLDFTATAAETRITFMNGDDRSDNSNGLDDVSLSDASASAAPARTPARVPNVMAAVEAGKGCPALAPIDAWGRRNVENHDYNEVFCGDFDRDGRADALAFVKYSMGNTMGHEVVLFRNVGGTLRFLRRVPELYGGPQTAAFAPGKVVLDLITMRPGDARCCPSGRTRVVVNVATGTHDQPR